MKHKIEDKLFSVINVIPNPIIVTSCDKIQSTNSAFLNFFGLTSIEEFNKTYGSIAKLFIKSNGFFTLSGAFQKAI